MKFILFDPRYVALPLVPSKSQYCYVLQSSQRGVGLEPSEPPAGYAPKRYDCYGIKTICYALTDNMDHQ